MASQVTSYERYKADTNLFTTWLGTTAKTCGWKPSSKLTATTNTPTTEKEAAKGPRLKGKARKLAKEEAQGSSASMNKVAPKESRPIQKYIITTEELLEQVDVVSTSRSSMMPDAIRKALSGAIKARQRCAAWFEKTNSATRESLDGHQYFIGVLQRALNKLGVTTPLPKSVPGLDAANEGEEDLTFMLNAFEALEVEDITEEETLKSLQSEAANESKTLNDSYEVKVDDNAEIAFKIFSLFEDIHRIRTELRQVWTQFRDGQIQLLQASVLTTAALEIVDQAEKEVYQAYATTNKATPNTYKDLAGLIYATEALTRGQDSDFMPEPTEIKFVKLEDVHKLRDLYDSDDDDTDLPPTRSLEIPPFDEFVLLPTGRTLLRLAQYKDFVATTGWPYPIPGMQLNYVRRPELLDDPRIQKFMKQDEFLCQVFLDMTLEEGIRRPGKKVRREINSLAPHLALEYDDPFHSIMRQVWSEGTVTTRMVFAAQVLWDMSEICYSAPSPLDIMKAASGQVQDSFKFFVDSSGTLDTEDVRWLSKDQGLIMKIYGRMSFNLVQPPVSMLKAMAMKGLTTQPKMGHSFPSEMFNNPGRIAKWEGNAKKIKADQMTEPNKDASFLLKANPLYAGTLLLDVAAMVEEAGVALANHHLSIFCVAHLYNALRRFGLLDVNWPDLERIIELHKGAIFANDIPSISNEMVARFSYRTGLSTPNSRRFETKKPWKFQTTPATQALRGFFGTKEPMSRLMDNLRTQAESHELKIDDPVLERSDLPKTGRSSKTLTLTPRHALVEMGRYIGAILPDIELDYVTLTRTCNKLLRQLRSRIRSEFGIDYPTIREYPGDSNDHSVMLVVLGILTEANDVSKKRSKRKKTKNEEPHDMWKNAPQLILARDMLKKCVEPVN
ncbi:hypothetical protein BU16DRAFT_615270 [Lophium mytilinum]|uniref:DUF6604 domain-containing protein n=1 Tax=Lophium mytilinum TaxID=390894 RepID=A0A6A6R0Z0_9PEZI|nr:hypothetical protein BU16DRAFT_615270 [Lophium mytilinum]